MRASGASSSPAPPRRPGPPGWSVTEEKPRSRIPPWAGGGSSSAALQTMRGGVLGLALSSCVGQAQNPTTPPVSARCSPPSSGR